MAILSCTRLIYESEHAPVAAAKEARPRLSFRKKVDLFLIFIYTISFKMSEEIYQDIQEMNQTLTITCLQ